MFVFLRLFLSAGIAKIPFIGIPFVIFYVLKDIFAGSYFLRNNIVIYYLISLSIILVLAFVRSVQGGGNTEDYLFILAIFFKFFIGPFIGYYAAVAYRRGFSLHFLALHSLLLTLAILSPAFYDFLLNFQSRGVRDVFFELNESRSLSFGLLHNEGAMFIAVNFMFLLKQEKIWRQNTAMFSFIFMAMSRMTGLFLLIILFIRKFKIFISLIVILLLLTGVPSELLPPIFNQAFEPVIFFVENRSFQISTIVTMTDMLIWPHDMTTWLLGDGLFFYSAGAFYMGTDLGFLRLIYFGGLTSLAVFLLINIFPVFFISKRYIDIFLMFILLLLANIKGLNPHPWMFFLLYFDSLKEKLPETGR